MKKSVVLLSSGLDSTVNFYKALKEHQVTMALTFDYGQRAAKNEISHAAKLCQLNNIPHKVVDLSWFKDFTQTSLVNTQKEIPKKMQIDNLEECHETAKAVWVPNRNGIMINIAAGFAEGTGADFVIVGFNKEEGATFPDNTPEYLEQLNLSFTYSTLNKIKVQCFTADMNKTEIVKLGKSLNVPFHLIWSCYFENKTACEECESCLRLKRALEAN